MKKYLIALIEIDGEKLNEWTGRAFTKALKDLKETTAPAGECLIYEVRDENGWRRAKSDLRRNKL